MTMGTPTGHDGSVAAHADGGVDHEGHGQTSIDQHWRDLVTVALLGTDRRDPPIAPAPIADVVADTARPSPSERMLAQVSGMHRRTSSGRPARADHRRTGNTGTRRTAAMWPAAVERWHHITTSWPVLEDEWLPVRR